MPYCTECGAEHAPDDEFCASCGAAISPDGEEDAATPAKQDPRTADSTADGGDGSGFVTRRKLLLGGGVVGGLLIGGAVLGTLGGGPQHQLAGDEAWDVTRETGSRSQRLSGTVTLPPGRYAARIVEPEVSAEYEIDFEVTSGGPIDVLMMNQSNYEDYTQKSSNIQFVAGLSETETTGERLTGTVSSRNYRVVVDNTGVYGASPNGEVEVDIEIRASV